MNIKTSKIFLGIVVLAGLVLIFMGMFGTGLYALVAFGLILATIAWNRIDSRGKAYKFQIQGPGGVKMELNSPDSEQANDG
jgi:hypothetical protein